MVAIIGDPSRSDRAEVKAAVHHQLAELGVTDLASTDYLPSLPHFDHLYEQAMVFVRNTRFYFRELDLPSENIIYALYWANSGRASLTKLEVELDGESLVLDLVSLDLRIVYECYVTFLHSPLARSEPDAHGASGYILLAMATRFYGLGSTALDRIAMGLCASALRYNPVGEGSLFNNLQRLEGQSVLSDESRLSTLATTLRFVLAHEVAHLLFAKKPEIGKDLFESTRRFAEEIHSRSDHMHEHVESSERFGDRAFANTVEGVLETARNPTVLADADIEEMACDHWAASSVMSYMASSDSLDGDSVSLVRNLLLHNLYVVTIASALSTGMSRVVEAYMKDADDGVSMFTTYTSMTADIDAIRQVFSIRYRLLQLHYDHLAASWIGDALGVEDWKSVYKAIGGFMNDAVRIMRPFEGEMRGELSRRLFSPEGLLEAGSRGRGIELLIGKYSEGSGAGDPFALYAFDHAP